jgi:MGT family glycosyltransferase
MACTFTFFPEAGAWGPTNNLLGIADVLRRRGHRCVFVVEESFAGVFEPHGIEERLMRVQPPPEVPEEPGQFWIDFIRDTAPIFRKPTIEQLGEFIHPTWVALIDGVKYANERVAEILDEVRPDVMVNDIVVSWRALFEYGSPWVRIVSCNPLELEALDLPPIFSGYPAADRTGWDEFRAEYRRTHAETWGEFDAYLREGGAPPLPELHFMHESPYLNIHIYPAEVDYPRAIPLGPTWHRLDSCVRATDAPFELPDDFTARDGKLVYLSLGSLGSADVELMQRLVDVLATTPHRVIVSKGPQHEKLRLASNMIGAEFLPQISILPHVDLVITHGGNNTFSESFRFGKPLVVLPLFWDQYDNAQRADETGFGVRLSTYGFEDAELVSAVDRLLADGALRGRMAEISARLSADPGTERAADLIERVARERRPVTR